MSTNIQPDTDYPNARTGRTLVVKFFVAEAEAEAEIRS
jgi:hypothetical protein